MNFKKSTFDVEPTLIHKEGRVVRICFDVEKVTETFPSQDGEEEEREVYKGYVVRVEQPIERSKVIDAIVTAGFPNDVMQAVVNNYLLSPEDSESVADFTAMQEWRAKAKQVATSVMEAMV